MGTKDWSKLYKAILRIYHCRAMLQPTACNFSWGNANNLSHILYCDLVQHHVGLDIQLPSGTGGLVLQREEATHKIKYIAMCGQICGGSSLNWLHLQEEQIFIKYIVIWFQLLWKYGNNCHRKSDIPQNIWPNVITKQIKL